MNTVEHSLKIGTVIDQRYRIDGILGEGGFGVTYKAHDQQLDYTVVIKEYLPQECAARSSDTLTVQARTNRADDYQYGLERFLDEARNLAKFQHPNIVRVSNFVQANGTAYFVMDYADGEELGQWFKANPGSLSEEAILNIVTPILDGLSAVHEQGLLHRDIKPSNIFLRKQSGPLLIDFGAARQALGEHSKSISAIVSQGYAPPEQYTSRGKQGPFTDLYAIGATLYYLITGKQPIESVDRSHEIHDGEPDPLVPAVDAGKGRVSDWLLQLTDQLLAVSTKQRPQSAEAVLEAIKNKTTVDISQGVVGGSSAQQDKANNKNTNNKTKVVNENERFSKSQAGSAPHKNGNDGPSAQSAKSNKRLLLGGVAVVIAAIGAGFYFTQSGNGVSVIDKQAVVEDKVLPKGNAIMFVESTPTGAEVYLDKVLLGKTPYQGDKLPSGLRQLTLKHDTANDVSVSLELKDNLVVKKVLKLPPASGNFSVFSTPIGAAIFIDGKDTGNTTPASLTNLAAGAHKLKLTKDAYYPQEQDIYVRKNETLRGDYTLEGGNLVQYQGQWVEPAEKETLIAEAKSRAEEAQRQADVDKANQLRTQAEVYAKQGNVRETQKRLNSASKLVSDSSRDADILAQAKNVQAKLEAEKKVQAEEERKAQEQAQSKVVEQSVGTLLASIASPEKRGNHSSVTINVPAIAENGAVVPVTLDNMNLMPGEHVTLSANGCDLYRLTNRGNNEVDYFATRIKLPSTSNVNVAFNSGVVQKTTIAKVTIGAQTSCAPLKNYAGNASVNNGSRTIKIRAQNKSGEVNIKSLINHPMNNNYITTVRISSGTEKLFVETADGISRNPYFSVKLKGSASQASLYWVDNQGDRDGTTVNVR